MLAVSDKLNKSPQLKLSITKPLTQSLASKTVIVLIINKNKPNVKRVSGNVRMIRIGLRKMFNKPRTIAKRMAVP